ncbi:MAG: LysE family transporter [Pseudomonadota bacterium]
MDALIALLTAALALMGSPGPATLSSAATGAAFGARTGLPYVIGISLGTATVVAAVAVGITGLVLSIPGLARVVTVLAAAYIVYLSWKIANSPPLGALERADDAPPLIAGYLLAIANPKAYAAIGALFSGFELVESNPVSDNLMKFVILAPLAFVINLIWMRIGSLLASSLHSPRSNRLVNLGFAIALIASVAATFIL